MRSEDRVEERRFIKRLQQQKREEEMQEALENVILTRDFPEENCTPMLRISVFC